MDWFDFLTFVDFFSFSFCLLSLSFFSILYSFTLSSSLISFSLLLSVSFSLSLSFLFFSTSHGVYFKYNAILLIFPFENIKKHPNSFKEILGKGLFHCALRSRIYSEIFFHLLHICIIISK